MYCMPDVHDPDFPGDLREGMVLHVSGFPITAERQFSAQLEMTFPQMLDREIIAFRGNNYTPRTLIEWYANKAGGSHYSRKLPEDFAALLALSAMNIRPLPDVLVQIGDATLAIGLRLLKSVVDFELHALVMVPDQDSDHVAAVNFLIDSLYEGSAMRLSLTLNKRLMPSLFISGLQEVSARVDADRLIDWSHPRHIHASVRIDDDLSTLLELWVDGTLVGRLRVPEPLFVFSDPLDYATYYNRAVDGEPQAFSFAVGAIGMFGREVGPIDRAQLLLYVDEKRQDPELPLTLYTSGSFGRAARGTNDVDMTGTVHRVKAQDLLRGVPDSSNEDVLKE